MGLPQTPGVLCIQYTIYAPCFLKNSSIWFQKHFWPQGLKKSACFLCVKDPPDSKTSHPSYTQESSASLKPLGPGRGKKSGVGSGHKAQSPTSGVTPGDQLTAAGIGKGGNVSHWTRAGPGRPHAAEVDPGCSSSPDARPSPTYPEAQKIHLSKDLQISRKPRPRATPL